MFLGLMKPIGILMLSRKNVQIEALSWVGTRWKHQGRNHNGVDCVGLIIMVAHALEYPYQDEKGYSRRPAGFDFLGAFRKQMDEIPNNEVQPGDVVVFKDTHYPCHCGIVVELYNSLYMVHSHAIHRRVIIDNFQDSKVWSSKWCNTFKFWGAE